jgi:hypothetical protein
MDRPIRIVVGEGRTAQRGLLRFVLEGEGFEVVGETSSTTDLPQVITSQQPDVVVLDDGIGVMAVSMVHDVAPDAKVVLVWPAAVVPIGGDARVEPAKILKDLGPAVEHVAVAAGLGLSADVVRPAWIERVRKDPATLRKKLAVGGMAAAGAKRRNVTRLQRRSRRLHPSIQEPAADAARRDDDAAVVVLPIVAAGAASAVDEPILDLSGTDAPVDAAPGEVEEPSEWNRRLGTLAMSGAAAVSALVLALALGGGRVGVDILSGGGSVPLGVPGFVVPGPGADGSGLFGFGGLGGSGYDPSASAAAYEARAAAAAAAADRDAGGSDTAGRILAPDEAGSRGDVATPPDDGADDGGSPDGGGGSGGGGNVGGHGNGGGNDAGADSALPGKSAAHNPHGGPPGQMGLTPAHGPGLGASTGQTEGAAHPHKV